MLVVWLINLNKPVLNQITPNDQSRQHQIGNSHVVSRLNGFYLSERTFERNLGNQVSLQ